MPKWVYVLLVVAVAAIAGSIAAYRIIEVTPYEEALGLSVEAGQFYADVQTGGVSGLSDIWDTGCSIILRTEGARQRAKDAYEYEPDTMNKLANAENVTRNAIQHQWANYEILYGRWPEWCSEYSGRQILAWE